MKNVDDLIESAAELAEQGLSKGEIADELNVSRETASWLVERSGAGASATAIPQPEPSGGPHDIHVDWSAFGRDSKRLHHAGAAMADLLGKQDDEVDLTIGTYAPSKHQWEEGDIDELGGTFSRNFAQIRDRECYVVDDTITSGTTMTETVEAIREEGGSPVACVVLVDKQGIDEVAGVPVHSLINVVRVGDDE
jgi:orotate phosphoribosyltransferase